ncbi:MAG: hypothetical protein AB1810_00045 [Pseudomonadota bacterium]
MGLKAYLGRRLARWLNEEVQAEETPLCDFNRLSHEIRPCDVLLVEGRTRVSQVIKTITQSLWTHSALYIGHLDDIHDLALRARILEVYRGDPHEPLLVDPLLGEGTVISPLSKYKDHHLRICRPRGLAQSDVPLVITHALDHLGLQYDLRQLLDLARFMFPYGILPRRWRSTLFQTQPGIPTKTVCSTMIASAFSSVRYPIRPVMHYDESGRLKMYQRNMRLYVPSDFDTSPYFDVVKYPMLGPDEIALYRQLPWDESGAICNTRGDCFIPEAETKRVERRVAQH